MGEAGQLSDLVAELCAHYPRFRPVTIERLVSRTAEEYRTARVTAYVPILVERQVKQQLRYVEDVPDVDLSVR